MRILWICESITRTFLDGAILNIVTPCPDLLPWSGDYRHISDHMTKIKLYGPGQQPDMLDIGHQILSFCQ